jgi:hypothetical protein
MSGSPLRSGVRRLAGGDRGGVRGRGEDVRSGGRSPSPDPARLDEREYQQQHAAGGQDRAEDVEA